MFKIVLLLVASALVIEASPTLARDLADAAKNGKWEDFQSLLRQHTQAGWGFQPALSLIANANVEDLKQPDDLTHIYGEAVSTFKQWSNVDGKVSEQSGGLQVVNRDGNVTKTIFTP